MWRCNEHCVLATYCGQPRESGHSNHVALQGTLCPSHILWTAAGQWTQQSCDAARNTVSQPHTVDSRRTVDTANMWLCKEHCVLATFCGQPQDSGHSKHVALQGTLCPGHILWTAAGQWTQQSCGSARNTVSWPHSVDSRRTVDTAVMLRCKKHCVLATFCGQPQDSGHSNHVALQETLCPSHILWTAAGQWIQQTCGAARTKDDDRRMAAAGFMFLTTQASKGVRGGPEAFWVEANTEQTKRHGGDELLVDLRNDGLDCVEICVGGFAE